MTKINGQSKSVETEINGIVTDPATRLIAILQHGLERTAQGQQFFSFWANALGVPSNDFVAIHRGLDLMRDLVDDVESAVRQIPDIRHEQYLKNIPLLRELFSRLNLADGWAAERNVLAMIINSLEFASERIQSYAPEPVLSPSELEDIRKQADELLDLLEKSSTLPRHLKLILFDLVKAILRSIDEYRFRGVRGVRRELFVVASLIQQHLPHFEGNKDAPEVKGFFALLKRIDFVTSVALKVKELMGAAASFLGQIPALLENLPK